MLLRFFPSRLESMGCQKQFVRNYHPAENSCPADAASLNKGVRTSALAWIALNGVIGALYFGGIIDEGILLLISLAYSVCDMICILFFCPFQSWFMKNRCCGTCRIYNWDFAMMFTPLIFIPTFYTWSLSAMGLALMIQWEVLVRLYPERFSPEHNRALSCAMCEEKLCHYKTQIRQFIRK